jgi:hypothetical protein
MCNFGRGWQRALHDAATHPAVQRRLHLALASAATG